MNELLKINYGTEQPTVSARDLHEKLEIGTKFTTWFERMCEYGFLSGKEFFPKLGETSEIGGRPPLDYDLTIRCAKEICMIQRTDIGRTIRNYLLDLEDAWNTPEQVFARALKMADETIQRLKVENLTLKSKADYFDELVDKNLLTNFRTAAKEFGIKESVFISWLQEHGYIYRDQKNKINPYAAAVKQGLFEVKEYASKYSDHAGTQTLITPKGRETFRLLLGVTDK